MDVFEKKIVARNAVFGIPREHLFGVEERDAVGLSIRRATDGPVDAPVSPESQRVLGQRFFVTLPCGRVVAQPFLAARDAKEQVRVRAVDSRSFDEIRQCAADVAFRFHAPTLRFVSFPGCQQGRR